MNSASTTASRWTVSTRTRGEVQTASVSAPALELVLLGIPSSFTVEEAEGWMRDLAGVAGETSREDPRVRAIPTLLHHALTGLLFSQAELWTQPGGRGPCSVAFVDGGQGGAFGWVGEARVQVFVDGGAFEPQWVIVRDQDGREAHAALLPGDRATTLGIEFWPNGEDGSEAPVAVEAEWLAANTERVTAIPAAAGSPAPVAHPEPPAESEAAVAAPPVPESATLTALPLQQPGFAAPPDLQAAQEDADDARAASVVVAPESPASTSSFEAMLAALGSNVNAEPAASVGGTMLVDDLPAEPVLASLATTEVAEPVSGTMLVDDLPAEPVLAGEAVEPAETPAPRTQHPVGRWLGRLLGFARRKPREAEPEAVTGEAPLSAYDSLLSASVPASELAAAEQTTLELPPLSPPLLVEPDAPDFAVHDPVAEAVQEPGPVEAPGIVSDEPPPVMAPASSSASAEPQPLEPVAFGPTGGSEAPVEPHATPGTPPATIEVTGPREEVVRAMHEVDASALPVLLTPAVQEAPDGEPPLQIDREPVGADASFALPRLPVRPEAPAGPPVFRAPEPPRAPEASAAPRIEPDAPPVLRVRVTPEAPSAPPMFVVAGSGRPAEAPPMLRVSASGAPPPAIVPTPPVAPIAAHDPAAAPAHDPSGTSSPAIARKPWPALDVPARRRLPKRAWAWVAVVAAVFAAGWLVGVVTSPTRKGEPGPVTRLLRAVGLGAPHFVASVNSSPGGAWIAVDGKDVARRTPADIELPPGAHTIKLSLPELGSAQVDVRGARDEKVVVTESLNGGLEVYSSDAAVPISVSLDGRDVGYAPVRLESVVPGLHELQFTGPGMPAWAQTVQVGVRRTMQVVAHPMSAPANGVVQVQAILNDERGTSPLAGAQVWVDGQLRGVTPASFELPRGPHSLKLTWHDEAAPVQVIDLPGGNQRFASFNFGLDNVSPQVVLLGGVHPANTDEQVIVSATLTSLQVGDVREAWLHVSTPEGIWRRYPMTAMPGPRGPVLVCVFPPASLANGSARWYVSASTPQGDEFFSEMQSASLADGGAARARRRAAGTPAP